MIARIEYKTGTLEIPNNLFEKSVLLTNLADDNMLESVIKYPYDLTSDDVLSISKYLCDGEIYLHNCNINNINVFFNYFGIKNVLSFYRAYYDYINDGSLLSVQKIYEIQRRIHDVYLMPCPQEFQLDTVIAEVGDQQFSWNLKVDFADEYQIINLTTLSECMAFPKIQYPYWQHEKIWIPNVDIFRGVIKLSESIWLDEFPWYKFDVGLAGGYILSSLTASLTKDTDIDLYLCNINRLGELLMYFRDKFENVTIAAPSDYRGGCSVLTLSMPDCRNLQIICAGYKRMYDCVRSFDLSHLRMWIDRDGLKADVRTIFELMTGISRYVKPNSFLSRLHKYIQKGWIIFGQNQCLNFPPEKQTNYVPIDLKSALVYCKEPLITLLGYINLEKILMGDIMDIHKSDIQSLRLSKLEPFQNLISFTPITLWLQTQSITSVQLFGTTSIYCAIDSPIQNQIINIQKELLNYYGVMGIPQNTIIENNQLRLNLSHDLANKYNNQPINYTYPVIIHIEFHAIMKDNKYLCKPCLIDILF